MVELVHERKYHTQVKEGNVQCTISNITIGT
jgi:hypothetical protein